MKLYLNKEDLISADYTMHIAIYKIAKAYWERRGKSQYNMYKQTLRKLVKKQKLNPNEQFDCEWLTLRIEDYKEIEHALKELDKLKEDFFDDSWDHIDTIMKHRGLLWY